MSLIQVTDVVVQNNPAPFQKPFEFLITFECQSPGLKEELEWKLIYVGSAENEKLDQELDSVLVGPVAIGRNQFLFSAPPPNHAKIPEKDLLEVTVILLTCAYKDKEFIRIGYYVNNEYIDNDYQKLLNEVHTKNQLIMAKHSEDLKKNPSTPSPTFIPPPPLPSPLDIKKVQRNILSGKPRVTRFNIAWDLEEKMPELTVEERKELEEQRKQNELGGGVIEGERKGGENNTKLSIMDEGDNDDEEDDDDDDDDDEEENNNNNNNNNNGEENIEDEDEEEEEEEEEDEEEEDDDQQNEMSISKKK